MDSKTIKEEKKSKEILRKANVDTVQGPDKAKKEKSCVCLGFALIYVYMTLQIKMLLLKRAFLSMLDSIVPDHVRMVSSISSLESGRLAIFFSDRRWQSDSRSLLAASGWQ